ncbi:MAG: RluA family pseudouridine synthase [Gammaproteobacteria bacterium]|nr:RluA family pseudouridine synthase [Gammaproteobacteria bacterium]
MTQTAKVNWLTVDEYAVGQRIDNFLLNQLKGVPRSAIYRILRRGEVRVNKGRIKPTYRLQIGDLVRIPPLHLGDDAPPAIIPDEVLQQLRQSIMYEDAAILVLNKPAGLAVHGGSGLRFGLIEALREMGEQYAHAELVHRLDRETSGCLVLAKQREALLTLQASWRSREVQKYYLALLCGRLPKGKHRVDYALLRGRMNSGERVVEIDEEGKAAISHFDVQEYYGEHSLVKIQIETGRMHQIRVHAAGLGHPVAGDEKYGDRALNKALKQQAGLKRLFLHASHLMFDYADEQHDYTAPLTLELNAVLEALT